MSILAAASLTLFSGCTPDPQTPKKPNIDVTLPMIENSSIRFIPDINSIAMEWKSVRSPDIKGYHIYRSNMQIDGQKFNRIATINSKYQTHYLDTDLEPNSKYTYGISTVSINNTESTASQSSTIQTLPILQSVSLVEAVNNLPRQIKIQWRPHTNERVSKYIVQKNDPKTTEWKNITTIKNRYSVEYIDDNLGDNDIFNYRVISVTFDDIESLPSMVVKGSTKPLPLNITNLSATQDLPRKIQLSWDKSKTDDVVKYFIYRSNSADGIYSKIYEALADHNRFDDNIAEDGRRLFYKVTTVDKDNLESDIKDLQPTMGVTLGKPKMPKITLSQQQGNKIIINWEAGDDRAVSYNVYKKQIESLYKSNEKMIPNVQGLRFEDPDVVRGVEYKYSLQSVDTNGLVSPKTEELTTMLPKLQENNTPQ